MMHLQIKGRPITKKNHMEIRRRRDGKPFIAQAKSYEAYEAAALWQIRAAREAIAHKVNVCCVYYMPTRGTVDLGNLLAATCDILKKAQVVKDDHAKIVFSHDGSYVDYDKENPRVEITITEVLS